MSIAVLDCRDEVCKILHLLKWSTRPVHFVDRCRYSSEQLAAIEIQPYVNTHLLG